jgi:hypothetical protein
MGLQRSEVRIFSPRPFFWVRNYFISIVFLLPFDRCKIEAEVRAVLARNLTDFNVHGRKGFRLAVFLGRPASKAAGIP